MIDNTSERDDRASRVSQFITEFVGRLSAAGVKGLDQYEQKLRSNTHKDENLDDLLFEGRAALALRGSGFYVLLRDSPDIEVTLDGEVAFVEVKHFREKEQDRIDEKAMCHTEDLLVRIGDTLLLEGFHPWEQISNVVISKAAQYVAGYPNILLIESDSESLELMLETAVSAFDDEAVRRNDPRLRRLNAVMLVNRCSIGVGCSGPENIEFVQTAHPAVGMSDGLASAFERVRLA